MSTDSTQVETKRTAVGCIREDIVYRINGRRLHPTEEFCSYFEDRSISKKQIEKDQVGYFALLIGQVREFRQINAVRPQEPGGDNQITLGQTNEIKKIKRELSDEIKSHRKELIAYIKGDKRKPEIDTTFLNSALDRPIRKAMKEVRDSLPTRHHSSFPVEVIDKYIEKTAIVNQNTTVQSRNRHSRRCKTARESFEAIEDTISS